MMLNEEQVVLINYVVMGFTNVEIAEYMGYSPSSIKRKLNFIYKLYRVEGRIALISKIVDRIVRNNKLCRT